MIGGRGWDPGRLVPEFDLRSEPGAAARRGTYCGRKCSAMKSMNALSLGVN